MFRWMVRLLQYSLSGSKRQRNCLRRTATKKEYNHQIIAEENLKKTNINRIKWKKLQSWMFSAQHSNTNWMERIIIESRMKSDEKILTTISIAFHANSSFFSTLNSFAIHIRFTSYYGLFMHENVILFKRLEKNLFS